MPNRPTSPTRALPMALALALVAAACTPPQATTYDQKVSKVEQLTKTLSLSQNEELKKAAASMQTLGGSMTKGGFANATAAAGGLVAAGGGNVVGNAGGGLVAAGGGNVVGNAGGGLVAAGGGNYLLTALVTDLNAGVRKDVYKLLGTLDGGNGSTLTYDDATGELTGISDGQTTAAFRFTNGGSKRTWTIDILKSPDGTTGTMTFEISADTWVAAQTPQARPTAPSGGEDADWWGTPAPSASPDFGGDEDPMVGEEEPAGGEEDEPAYGDDQAYGDDEGYDLAQAQAQVKIFNNEVPDPNTLTAFRFACDLTPQADATLRVKLDAVIDDVKTTAQGRMPTHLGFNLTVPTVQFTSDTSLDGTTKFASKGGLKVRTAEGTESLRYDMDLALGENTGKMDLVHEGAKVRMGLVATKGSKPGVPATQAALYDTESNAKIADLEPVEGSPSIVLIKFTNGKTIRWDVAGGTTTVTGGSSSSTGAGSTGSASARPSAAPTAPRASATPFVFN